MEGWPLKCVKLLREGTEGRRVGERGGRGEDGGGRSVGRGGWGWGGGERDRVCVVCERENLSLRT